MKKIIVLSVFLVSFFSMFSQTVENIVAKLENNKIVITYDLLGNGNSSYFIQIFASFDNFAKPLVFVSGEVGTGRKIGRNKIVYWDYVAEKSDMKGSIDIKVIAKEEISQTNLSTTVLNVPAKLKVNSSQNLVWTPSGSSKINISLYSNGVFVKNIASNVDNTGSYVWKIDNNDKGKNYRIRLVDVNDANNFCTSNFFAIIPKKSIVTSILVGLGVITAIIVGISIIYYAAG